MLESGSQVLIRTAKPSDAKVLSDIFRKSWREAYLGIIPHLHLEALIERRRPIWWQKALRNADGSMILDVGGTVAGYVTCGPSRSRGNYQGEIFELYLTPDYQGLGLGEHLFESARHNLDERRLRGLIVWALTDNIRACDFYWRRGGRPFAESCDRFGSTKLSKVAFGWQ